MSNHKDLIIIGTGSIAHRHFFNISNLKDEITCYCLSKSGRTINGCRPYNQRENTQFDIVVIASVTHLHDSDMHFAISVVKSEGLIFVEKPISLNVEEAEKIEYEILKKNLRVVVGYDLRYHEGISHLKKVFDEEISVKSNFIYDSSVGQNLDTWRKSQHNFKSYSYSQEKSGGIVNDLSHEIDLAIYLTGIKKSFSVQNYQSKIFNDTLNDFSKLELSLERKDELKRIFISIDCISHRFYRYIDILTKEKNYFLDLLSGSYKEFSKGSLVKEIKFENDRNYRNQQMWKEILSGSDTKLPSYQESLLMLRNIT